MSNTTPPPPPHPGTTSAFPPRRSRRPRRGRLVALVLAASLVTGGAAGVGGAVAWDQVTGDQAESASAGAGRTTDDSPAVSNDSAAPVQATKPQSVAAVAEEVLPSVVKIDVRTPQGGGSGSGVILSEDGKILTNNHVVAAGGQGGRLTVSFDDGTSAPARVLGTDPVTDTAVIQAEDVSGLEPASIGDSSDLRVGQSVVAVGSPFGLDATVTKGIVSALNRAVTVGSDREGTATVYPAVQTDAAINPGNSGGPLVDRDGNVVGINSSIRTSGGGIGGQGGSIGLGFAIPIDEIMPLVDQMAAGEEPTHARLGISVSDTPPGTNPAAGVGGALVRKVGSDTAANQAGLESGDVITKIDDQTITDADTLIATIRSYRPGDDVSLSYVRDGESQQARVTLGSD